MRTPPNGVNLISDRKVKAFSIKNNNSIQNLQFLTHFGMDSQGILEEKPETLSFLVNFEIGLRGDQIKNNQFLEKK